MDVVENKEFMMMPARPGLCTVCAFDHASDLAHNLQSLAYQVGFKLRWERDPTWADACAHLTVPQREAWRIAMKGRPNGQNRKRAHRSQRHTSRQHRSEYGEDQSSAAMGGKRK